MLNGTTATAFDDLTTFQLEECMDEGNPTAKEERAILKELAATIFTAAEVGKLMTALEAVGAGRVNSPRPFLEQRIAYVQDLLAGPWRGRRVRPRATSRASTSAGATGSSCRSTPWWTRARR